MVEINSSVENPQLLQAMSAFQREPSQESEENLAAAFASAQFLLLVRDASDGEDGSVNIDVPALSGPDGSLFPFGFTDLRMLKTWSQRPVESLTTIQLTFADVAQLVLRPNRRYAGFAINPGDASQHVLSAKMVAAYSGSAMPMVMPEHTQLMLGPPHAFPEAMGQAVREAIAPLWAVKRLWLLLKMERGCYERSFLILVDHLGGNLQQICDVIGHAAGPHLPQGAFVELMPADSQLATAALRQHPSLLPFYSRES